MSCEKIVYFPFIYWILSFQNSTLSIYFLWEKLENCALFFYSLCTFHSKIVYFSFISCLTHHLFLECLFFFSSNPMFPIFLRLPEKRSNGSYIDTFQKILRNDCQSVILEFCLSSSSSSIVFLCRRHRRRRRRRHRFWKFLYIRAECFCPVKIRKLEWRATYQTLKFPRTQLNQRTCRNL